MSDKAILRRFADWRGEGRTLVLATVVETAGSTYTKAGHRILIADNGDYQGLVSGGCLEGDLALHAQEVIGTGDARVVTYDLRGEADELFGLGIGCDGLLRILLQRLAPDSDYQPFAGLAALLLGEDAGVSALVLDGRRAGTTVCVTDTAHHCGPLDAPAAAALEVAARRQSPLPVIGTVHIADEEHQVLFAKVTPLPRLLVLGAGLDAIPVVGLAGMLGWRVTVVDHRPAYIERAELASAEERRCIPAEMLAEELAGSAPLVAYAAAIVMSHHLATDRTYLRALAASSIPYIGLLGPAARRDRLLRELDGDGNALAGRLHGPAGLPIGADSPESIALSILCEIQALQVALR